MRSEAHVLHDMGYGCMMSLHALIEAPTLFHRMSQIVQARDYITNSHLLRHGTAVVAKVCLLSRMSSQL